MHRLKIRTRISNLTSKLGTTLTQVLARLLGPGVIDHYLIASNLVSRAKLSNGPVLKQQ